MNSEGNTRSPQPGFNHLLLFATQHEDPGCPVNPQPAHFPSFPVFNQTFKQRTSFEKVPTSLLPSFLSLFVFASYAVVVAFSLVSSWERAIQFLEEKWGNKRG
ncbi:hypothetical protein Ddc_00822 [Ditylenchus destructor]|nr:hypothetical protein Ddc_00822 [Ditylenchus destructor]